MKIGLFGGSFNPIHKAHLEIINKVLDKNILDEIWILPCKDNEFKETLEIGAHRKEMIRLAIQNLSNVKINEIELNSKSKSQTYNTLKKLKKQYPHEFFFIIGSDILYEIEDWYKSKELLEEISFIIYPRKKYSFKKVNGLNIFYIVQEAENSLSSTQIKDYIKENKSFEELVPLDVMRYIEKEGLYK